MLMAVSKRTIDGYVFLCIYLLKTYNTPTPNYQITELWDEESTGSGIRYAETNPSWAVTSCFSLKIDQIHF